MNTDPASPDPSETEAAPVDPAPEPETPAEQPPANEPDDQPTEEDTEKAAAYVEARYFPTEPEREPVDPILLDRQVRADIEAEINRLKAALASRAQLTPDIFTR